MKKVDGYFVSWEEAEEMLKCALDDSTIELHFGDRGYWAYSESNDILYDMGQIDERLAQEIGFDTGYDLNDDPDRYVGFICSFGIVIIDRHQTKQ